MVHTRLAKLGNSQGFRVPRLMLEAAGIHDAVTIEVRNDEIVIRREEPADLRANWAEEFRLMAARDAAAGAEGPMQCTNRFDHEEWEW